jgi:hypothetical protein
MRKRHFLLAAGIALSLGSVFAGALGTPTGKVVLTITGKIGQTNSPQGAQFDMVMLEKLPQHSFTTLTPWGKKPIQFTGPLLRDVLAAVKAQGSVITAMALNDYQTSIPVEDAMKYDMVIAHKMNGQAIAVKTKGPLFIIYPFDAKPELRSATYYERSPWQLKSLTLK